jgi:uncharacterized Zn finger protein
MSTKENIMLFAKSSSGAPYTVTFDLEENTILAFCSCPAGDNRMLCKHIIKMISGDKSILYDDTQKHLLNQILSHLDNTPIPLLLSELDVSEKMLAKVQKDTKKAKKNLEKAIFQK